jgi:hypothetical protein
LSSTTEKLTWPPGREDLERLYVERHLSAMKIANVYGLNYASRKTAESTVLYHLKKNGIRRRDPAEHVRKVTESMVDDWVRRYQNGESLKQIAGELVSPVTVWNHLKKRGITLRDKVEAQIATVMKFERPPFRGDSFERAYVLGFVWGDCSVERHGRAIRVRTGTTHPGFVHLFTSLFGSYGRIRTYPKKARLTSAELNLEVDLDGTFEFLLQKAVQPVPDLPKSDTKAKSFLAGFFDAEGSIYFHQKASPNFEAQITNRDHALLQWMSSVLAGFGFHPRLYHHFQRAGRIESVRESDIWNLHLHRREEVRRLLVELPLRHKEKTTKAKLAVAFIEGHIALNLRGTPEGWEEYLGVEADRRKDFLAEIVSRTENANQGQYDSRTK